MATDKRDRERIEELDFPILEEKTISLEKLLLSIFSCQGSQNQDWPHRYIYTFNQDFSFELIFSQMGSFTLRPVRSERFRRNPPPIFYMSLGKYASSSLVWEDLNASPVGLEPNDLKKKIEDSIQLFISNSEIL